MDASGADILKMAVMPQRFEDVADLMQVTSEVTEEYTEKPVIVSLRFRQLCLEKDLHQQLQLHGLCTRSMPTGFHFTGRKRTGSSMGCRSAGRPLQTGSSTVQRTIFSQCTITFIGSC